MDRLTEAVNFFWSLGFFLFYYLHRIFLHAWELRPDSFSGLFIWFATYRGVTRILLGRWFPNNFIGQINLFWANAVMREGGALGNLEWTDFPWNSPIFRVYMKRLKNMLITISISYFWSDKLRGHFTYQKVQEIKPKKACFWLESTERQGFWDIFYQGHIHP